VADNGPGIDPGLRERVFERFFRVGGSDSTGAGLGLAIVREAAASVGAVVTLEAAEGGRGCRFNVRLTSPACAADPVFQA
jgi:signal transduction histidine kinase